MVHSHFQKRCRTSRTVGFTYYGNGSKRVHGRTNSFEPKAANVLRRIRFPIEIIGNHDARFQTPSNINEMAMHQQVNENK